MQCFIMNEDRSMYVHELHGVEGVTWVSSLQKEKALPFPEATAEDWVKLIAAITGVRCIATNYL